jgi:hypothetical protein
MDKMARKGNIIESEQGIYPQLTDVQKQEIEDEEDTTLGSDIPIDPSPQMATQLSTERPPIEDDDFIPASVEELSKSAHAISELVPDDQIDWFYKQLHKLLDAAVDRSAKPPEEEEMKEESIRKSIRRTLFELLSEQTGDLEDEDEFGEYKQHFSDIEADEMLKRSEDDGAGRGASDVDWFGEEPEPASLPAADVSKDEMSLEDLAAEFGYAGAPGVRQEINRLADRMKYFVTKVRKEDLAALVDYAVGEYIDAMDKADLLDDPDVEELRRAPHVVKDLDSFRFFFTTAFILPAYKDVAKEAAKKVKSEINDLGLPKEIHQTIYNQVTGATKKDPALIQKKLMKLVQQEKINSVESREIQDKIRRAIAVLKSVAELSDNLVQKSLDKWQSLNASKRKSLLTQALKQTTEFQS